MRENRQSSTGTAPHRKAIRLPFRDNSAFSFGLEIGCRTALISPAAIEINLCAYQSDLIANRLAAVCAGLQ